MISESNFNNYEVGYAVEMLNKLAECATDTTYFVENGKIYYEKRS